MGIIGKPYLTDEDYRYLDIGEAENYKHQDIEEAEDYMGGGGAGYWDLDIWKVVKDLSVGERGFLEPYSLRFDSKHTPYIQLNGDITSRKEGEFWIPISRIDRGAGDFDVDIRGVNFLWIASDEFYYEENLGIEFAMVTSKLEDDLIKSVEGIEIDVARFPKTNNLRKDLARALKREDYEEAARLRDFINGYDDEMLRKR